MPYRAGVVDFIVIDYKSTLEGKCSILMKGIVFTEFLEMVEQEFGYEMVDGILSENDLESDGIYTATGTYDHAEIIALLTSLSTKTKVQSQILLNAFGKYLFDTFLKGYPDFFTSCNSAFEFLKSVDSHIHVEVRKLYPEATLPEFQSVVDGDTMTMTYKSDRKMSDLAHGLIEKSLEYYGEKDFEISKEILDDDGATVLFTINCK